MAEGGVGIEEGRSLCWPSTRIKEQKLIEKTRECHITSRNKSLTLRGREKSTDIDVCKINIQMHEKQLDQLPLHHAR